jgi:hypothetical protein
MQARFKSCGEAHALNCGDGWEWQLFKIRDQPQMARKALSRFGRGPSRENAHVGSAGKNFAIGTYQQRSERSPLDPGHSGPEILYQFTAEKIERRIASESMPREPEVSKRTLSMTGSLRTILGCVSLAPGLDDLCRLSFSDSHERLFQFSPNKVPRRERTPDVWIA